MSGSTEQEERKQDPLRFEQGPPNLTRRKSDGIPAWPSHGSRPPCSRGPKVLGHGVMSHVHPHIPIPGGEARQVRAGAGLWSIDVVPVKGDQQPGSPDASKLRAAPSPPDMF